MKKIYTTFFFVGSFFFELSTAYAIAIQPGMLDDFENGTTMGWIKGPAPAKDTPDLPPMNVVNTEGDNRYLQVKAIGGDDNSNEREAHSRLVFFNELQWTGDYSAISSIKASMMAISDTQDYLHMRLGIVDDVTSGETNSRYVSASDVLLKADGNWHDIALSMAPEDFIRFRGEKDILDVLTNVSSLRIFSSSEPVFWGMEKIAVTFGIDNIEASASHVPLPGAAGLMIISLLSLAGGSFFKRLG